MSFWLTGLCFNFLLQPDWCSWSSQRSAGSVNISPMEGSFKERFSIVLGIWSIIIGGWLYVGLCYVVFGRVSKSRRSDKSDIQIIYYFYITLYNYVQTIVVKYFFQLFHNLFHFADHYSIKYFLQLFHNLFHLQTTAVLKTDNPLSIYKPIFFCIILPSQQIPQKYNYKFTHLRAILGPERNIKQVTSFFHPRLFLIEK